MCIVVSLYRKEAIKHIEKGQTRRARKYMLSCMFEESLPLLGCKKNNLSLSTISLYYFTPFGVLVRTIG